MSPSLDYTEAGSWWASVVTLKRKRFGCKRHGVTAPQKKGFSVGVVETWAPCLRVSLRLGRAVTNLRRGWGRKV